MSLTVLNTKKLIDPESFKIKALLVAPPGFGKTEFLGGVEGIGIAACESGVGSGLLTIANKGIDYVVPDTISELEGVCAGLVFKDKPAIGLDSLSHMEHTIIRKAALAIPRQKGESLKRNKGIPELDDYGVMGVMTRDLVRLLIGQPKHVIVTAQIRIQTPDAETGKGDYLIGPDLPGAMFLGAPGMFDIVLVGKTRSVTKDIDGIKRKVSERYWITAPDGIHLAKCRSKALGNQPLLPAEIIYDLNANTGTWSDIYARIKTAYTAIYAAEAAAVPQVS